MIIYKKEREKLDLEDYKPYTGDEEDRSILKSEKKSFIDVANSQLTSNVFAFSIFYQTLVDPSKLQLVNSQGLSDIQYNYQNAS